MNHNDIINVQHEIRKLLLEHPELAEDEVLREDMFEGQTRLHDVISAVYDAAENAAETANAISARMNNLHERGGRYARRNEALRKLISSLMEMTGLSKVTLPEATFSLSFRKGSPIITNMEALPEEYWRVKREPDMAKIKAAELLPPGVSLSNGKNVLTIRTK